MTLSAARVPAIIAVTIYHGNCLDVLPEIGQVDLVLTDPPFSATTHEIAAQRCAQEVLAL